jgi:hypothetical protein
MTAVESCLSDTADYLQSTIRNNPELAAQFRALLEQDSKPQILRELKGVCPGAQVLIVVGDTLVG